MRKNCSANQLKTSVSFSNIKSTVLFDSLDSPSAISLSPSLTSPTQDLSFVHLPNDKIWLTSYNYISSTLQISVKNISFEKKVSIRFTIDSWKTWHEIEAKWSHSFMDTDVFTVFVQQTCDFCLVFRCGSEEYWNNNFGDNYRITAVPMLSCDQIEESIVFSGILFDDPEQSCDLGFEDDGLFKRISIDDVEINDSSVPMERESFNPESIYTVNGDLKNVQGVEIHQIEDSDSSRQDVTQIEDSDSSRQDATQIEDSDSSRQDVTQLVNCDSNEMLQDVTQIEDSDSSQDVTKLEDCNSNEKEAVFLVSDSSIPNQPSKDSNKRVSDSIKKEPGFTQLESIPSTFFDRDSNSTIFETIDSTKTDSTDTSHICIQPQQISRMNRFTDIFDKFSSLLTSRIDTRLLRTRAFSERVRVRRFDIGTRTRGFSEVPGC